MTFKVVIKIFPKNSPVLFQISQSRITTRKSRTILSDFRCKDTGIFTICQEKFDKIDDFKYFYLCQTGNLRRKRRNVTRNVTFDIV